MRFFLFLGVRWRALFLESLHPEATLETSDRAGPCAFAQGLLNQTSTILEISTMNRSRATSILATAILCATLTPATANDNDERRGDDNDNRSCSSGPAVNGAQRNNHMRLGNSLRIVGLTSDGQLVCFNERQPGRTRTIGNVTGFTGGDTRLIGLDFRVQDGLLYGVGNAGGL